MDGYELFLLPVLEDVMEARMNARKTVGAGDAGDAGGKRGSADAEEVSMETESM